jgi:hypothetical protein
MEDTASIPGMENRFFPALYIVETGSVGPSAPYPKGTEDLSTWGGGGGAPARQGQNT